MKYFILLLFISLASTPIMAQESILVDERDGQVYPIIKLGGQQWFGENLRFISEKSWCHEHGETPNCEQGNFYHFTELEEVCPDGWHVPTWKEWKSGIDAIKEIHAIPEDSAQWQKWPAKWAEKERHEFIEGIKLLDDTLGLNVKSLGWIQGEEWEDPGTTTFWVIDEPENDPPAHIHITETSHKKHAHTHNIYTKPKKQRRFALRCVSDQTQ